MGPGQGQGGPRREGGGPRRPFRRDDRRDEGMERREPQIQLPEVEASILPEGKGVEALAHQIKLYGRAYPLFDIARLVLKKPDRYTVRFDVIKKQDGTVVQPLFVCSLDESLWFSEQEAMEHVLRKNFDMFYQAEKIPSDPPKGVFTFVAQCGMSGVVLGPPNIHDYQAKLRKLHSERYAHMSFDVYKSRVKIVRDEAVVKKWVDDQSFKTEYVCLNVPETIKLGSREEVEAHFRVTHLPNVIAQVETFTLGGGTAQSQPNHAVVALVRRAFAEQSRFPIKVVTTLSQMFASQGLQFFKVNKTLTHVAVSRPHFLDVNLTPVSEGIKRILNYINANPGSNRRRLMDTLAPAPTPVAPIAPTAAPAPVVEGATAEPAVPAPAPDVPIQTREMAEVVTNLHWLIHQGHVIEFANGALETAKPPLPRPVRPAPRQTEKAKPEAPAPAQTKDEAEAAMVEAALVESGVLPVEPAEAPVAEAPAAEAPAAAPAAAEAPVAETPTTPPAA
jgi:hypothetical protein